MPSQFIRPGGTQIDARPYNIGTWQPTVAASATAGGGQNLACTDGTIYYAGIWVPGDVLATGIGYLIGNTGGTDKVIASLHDESGGLLANSAVAGVTVGTQSTIQKLPFTAPYKVQGPGLYLIGLTFNGATAKFSGIINYCHLNQIAGSATQTFGTPANFTVSSTVFTDGKGPIAHLY